jgi:threonine/homoserine/homoserine lactone efflux protein
MVFKGFRFGMLLQLAVGPVCVFIFQAASAGGFVSAETGVAGVALVDALYIAAAILGIAAFVGRKHVRTVMRFFGAAVLCLFGATTILGQFGVNPMPVLNIAAAGTGSVLLRAVIITASNPLTILFWAGVFSAKVAELKMARKDAWLYGLGAVLSTVLFLTAVAAVGSGLKAFLPDVAITVMNIAVGAALIFFGVKMVASKK